MSGQPTPPKVLAMTRAVWLSSVALVALLLSQSHFRDRFTTSKIELPLQTEIALSWIPPVILTATLLISVAAKYTSAVRFQVLWEPMLVIIIGMVIGHHIIAMFLPFMGGPVDLSLLQYRMITHPCAAQFSTSYLANTHSYRMA
jgi:hypothetical protein